MTTKRHLLTVLLFIAIFAGCVLPGESMVSLYSDQSSSGISPLNDYTAVGTILVLSFTMVLFITFFLLRQA